MLKLYKNKNQEFSCKIKIEGADKSTAKPRLILYPNNDSRNVFFEGKIEDDVCKINVLPNLNISQNGKAVLEVIIENSIIFQPWNTEYEIISEQVKVEEINISNSFSGASVKVLDDIKINNKNLIKEEEKNDIDNKKHDDENSINVKKNNINNKKDNKVINNKKQLKLSKTKIKKSFDELLEEASNMIRDDDKEDKKLLKIYNESIKSLSKEELNKMIKYVKNEYVPNKKSLIWAKKNLGETQSTKAKLLMYTNEIKNRISGE